jgi:hypothetical protein
MFPEPKQWNGAPGECANDDYRDRQSRHVPAVTVYRCLRCGWRGKGSIARAEHHRRFGGHGHIVPKADPRFTLPATASEVA